MMLRLISLVSILVICCIAIKLDYKKKLLIAHDDHAFGLGNQLNDFARLCHLACIRGKYFSVEFMKYDVRLDKLGPVDAVIDINRTNARIQEMVETGQFNCSSGHVPQWIAFDHIGPFSNRSWLSFAAVRNVKRLNSDMVTSFVLSSNLTSGKLTTFRRIHLH